MGATRHSDLIAEARETQGWPNVGLCTPACPSGEHEHGRTLIGRLADALEAVGAERDTAIRDLDAGFAESDHLSAKYYQRMRDAEREMHSRELHHFEEEQARAKAEAERDDALAAIADAKKYITSDPLIDLSDMMPGRIILDTLSRIPEHPKED